MHIPGLVAAAPELVGDRRYIPTVLARIEHHEIIAQAVHFHESGHGGRYRGEGGKAKGPVDLSPAERSIAAAYGRGPSEARTARPDRGLQTKRPGTKPGLFEFIRSFLKVAPAVADAPQTE